MLRTERAAVAALGRSARTTQRQLLLALAPLPRPAHSFALSGWPSWLIPAYRAGGHRPSVRLLEEER